eukprot:gnl/TRDRNA2_/TRDRNA2_145007_c0_seq3.p1 gnl/TRDRNA2_/TRDRNA2_145007_c0~~gnl/TRDRNA2_/TRDRNA2_145007_c0_seq3.p1  ORF type:complete len:317 (+),score=31.35 gnl/TRDRNA2_/TRDRNA2_145007_c0_seq3:34-984(+)
MRHRVLLFLATLLLLSCNAVLSRTNAVGGCTFSSRGILIRTQSPIHVLRERSRTVEATESAFSLTLPPDLRSTSLPRRQVRSRAQTDPEYCESVENVMEQLRKDHLLLPFIAPGLGMALPTVKMELAQIRGIAFDGKNQYSSFWDFFRTAVQILSTQSRSEVISINLVDSQIRISWRLQFTSRVIPLGKDAANAVRAVQNTFGGFIGDVADGLLSGGEKSVDFDSIYELGLNGKIVSHMLDFRTPEDSAGLLPTLQRLLPPPRPAAEFPELVSDERTSHDIMGVSTAVLICFAVAGFVCRHCTVTQHAGAVPLFAP